MPRPTYYEQLQDPRWQRKRLEIMERAGFKCEICGDSKSTLSTHHKYYETGVAPWDYPDYSLLCLCEVCHTRMQDSLRDLMRWVGKLDEGDLSMLIGYAKGITLDYDEQDGNESSVKANNFQEAEGIGHSLCTSASTIFESMINGSTTRKRIILAKAE